MKFVTKLKSYKRYQIKELGIIFFKKNIILYRLNQSKLTVKFMIQAQLDKKKFYLLFFYVLINLYWDKI